MVFRENWLKLLICGIYVEPENVEGIVAGVHKALEMRGALDKMGAKWL